MLLAALEDRAPIFPYLNAFAIAGCNFGKVRFRIISLNVDLYSALLLKKRS